MMARFMVIGPLTRDKIVKNGEIYLSTGGPVYYQTTVLSQLGVDNTGIITLAESDVDLINDLPLNTDVIPIYTEKTMEFENIYPNHNPSHRIQRAVVPKNHIKPQDIFKIDFRHYNALLLCPLSPYDIPLKTLGYLSHYEIPIYLGAQGYLRHIKNSEVILKPWKDFKRFLIYVNLLFLDEVEARVLTGSNGELEEIADRISRVGPEEIIITRGDLGAFIYSRKARITNSYKINAFSPRKIVDPTGLGDTFMAAYAYRKTQTEDPQECGIFASAVSSLKIEHKGAFHGDLNLIKDRMKDVERISKKN